MVAGLWFLVCAWPILNPVMKYLLALLFFCSSMFSGKMAADSSDLPQPNWSRDSAVLITEHADTQEILASLYRLAREGQGGALLQEVIALDRDTTLPEPVRDRIIFELAVSLGDFEPGSLGPETLEYLKSRKSLARVPHEENPAMGVPLYNVRAAAAGSLAAWARIEQSNGDRAKAETTAPLRDANSFLGFIAAAKDPAIARHVRTVAGALYPAELEAIVLAAPHMADSTKAAIIIGELAPQLLDHPSVSELMFELLDHTELGAGAALVLGNSGDDTVLARLADTAARDKGLAARRASLAIDRFLAAEQAR